MKCDRCGRQNPDHLKFCQDCGNRLAPAGGRAVEPTPPRGVALQPQNASSGASTESSTPIRSRPPAPQFDFAPRLAQAEIACPQCGSKNPSGSRFCSECGTSLDANASQASAGSLLGAPVVGVARPAPPADDRIVCSRCRGTNTGTMSFCQYCGARLETGAPDRRERVRTNPESPLARGSVPPEPAAATNPPPPPPSSRPPPRPVQAPPPSARRAPPPAPVRQAHPVTAPLEAVSVETGKYAPAELPAAAARLVVIAQDGSAGRDYPLVSDQTDIGRDEGNILLANDPYVSPRHARILRRQGHFFVQDLDSVNGVYVRLKNPQTLEHGDLVLMGLEVLRFEVVSAADKGYGPATDRDTQVFGSPAAPRYARLLQRTVEGVTRDAYYVTRDETVIGRESGDIVFTGDPFMSRRHAAFNRNTDGSFSVRDLGSSNGSYVRIRGEREIENGDHVRIGQHLFRLEVASGGQG